MAFDPDNGTYVGIQAKCNLKQALSARHLGTFFHVVMRMRSKDTRHSGVVYHAGDLTYDLKHDIDVLANHGIHFVQLSDELF
jgi:hypothetical protein